jgi:hypothetical protein
LPVVYPVPSSPAARDLSAGAANRTLLAGAGVALSWLLAAAGVCFGWQQCKALRSKTELETFESKTQKHEAEVGLYKLRGCTS